MSDRSIDRQAQVAWHHAMNKYPRSGWSGNWVSYLFAHHDAWTWFCAHFQPEGDDRCR